MSLSPASRARSLPAALLSHGDPSRGTPANALAPWRPKLEMIEFRSNAPPITPAAEGAAVPRHEPPGDGPAAVKAPPVFQRGSGFPGGRWRTLGTDARPVIA